VQTPTSTDFEMIAAPGAWLEVAKDLNEQAHALRRVQLGMNIYRNRHGQITRRNRTNRGVFLLAGFSLENLLKSYLVFENPAYVANGILDRRVRTHSLTRLRSLSRRVPYKNRFAAVLAAFENGLESWARYPCGLTATSPSFELEVTPKLWKGYDSMFRLYQARLERLLTSGWRAPSGGKYRMKYSKAMPNKSFERTREG